LTLKPSGFCNVGVYYENILLDRIYLSSLRCTPARRINLKV
jgi:hypothetical protein